MDKNKERGRQKWAEKDKSKWFYSNILFQTWMYHMVLYYMLYLLLLMGFHSRSV